MNQNQIASDLSYAVWLKQQQEQNGRPDVPKVKAPAETPAKFVATGKVR